MYTCQVIHTLVNNRMHNPVFKFGALYVPLTSQHLYYFLKLVVFHIFCPFMSLLLHRSGRVAELKFLGRGGSSFLFNLNGRNSY